MAEPAAPTVLAPSSSTTLGGHHGVVLVAFAAEAGLLAAGALGLVGSAAVCALHVVIVSLMAIAMQRAIRTGADGGIASLSVIGTLATGPFGAAGALLMPWLTRTNTTSAALLAAWYQRIALSAEQDAFTQLSDRIAIGRAANLAAPSPQPFVELFKSGPIAEQQAALGIIARAFHPGYLPVLKIALDSPEPVIRVQAAAVAARVRGDLNAQVAELFKRAADPTLTPGDAIEIVSELSAAIDSGLLETSEHATASGIQDGLLGRTLSRLDVRYRKVFAGKHPPYEATGIDVDDRYAAHLLAQGRFDQFRALRLTKRAPWHGRYRHRLVGARQADAALMGRLRAVTAVRR